jgi:hypothetical protein
MPGWPLNVPVLHVNMFDSFPNRFTVLTGLLLDLSNFHLGCRTILPESSFFFFFRADNCFLKAFISSFSRKWHQELPLLYLSDCIPLQLESAHPNADPVPDACKQELGHLARFPQSSTVSCLRIFSCLWLLCRFYLFVPCIFEESSQQQGRHS